MVNAVVALYTAKLAQNLADGIGKEREAIESGAARAKVDAFARATQRFA